MRKIEEAIKKINDEVQKKHSNTYLVLIGEHIIDCITSEEAASRVMEKGKSLNGCLSHIQKEAAKQKHGQVAVVQGTIVYQWAREYFGLTGGQKTANPQTPAEEPKKTAHLSLEDFF